MTPAAPAADIETRETPARRAVMVQSSAPLLLILTAANDDRNQEPPTMERPPRHPSREHDRQR